MHSQTKKQRVLILGADWKPYEIRTFQNTIPDLMNGKLHALDKWMRPYNMSNWESKNSGWQDWLEFSELLLSMTPHERGLDWEFFSLASHKLIAYPQICVIAPSTNKWKRKTRVPLDECAIFARDFFSCAYCGRPVTIGRNGTKFMPDTATIDHIIPTSRWDKWAAIHKPKWNKESWQNKCCACFECNHSKGNRLNEEIGYSLRVKPYIPSWSLHRGIKLSKNHIKESWIDFLWPDINFVLPKINKIEESIQ